NNSSYINQFIKTDFFQKELDKRTLKVAFPQKINLSDIGECLVKLPCLEEQQKIANFLSSIDNKIDNLATELEDLKEFKKGLLQQMFV
ncbi:restriction endonuclease subunit S, partial [uncultured Fusobacterium sp.]|uniref:restriction endonuclease subunit S n=1 Tax=uncultured Fusobacterium sp. TaxID=159267 RepID=UPI0028048EF3